jgi:hypothetical protein
MVKAGGILRFICLPISVHRTYGLASRLATSRGNPLLGLVH